MTKIKKLHCDFPRFTDLVDAYIPPFVIIPLLNAEGELCTSKAGDNTRVSEGDIIAQKSALTPAIHATVPGIISKCRPVSIPNGKKANAVIIRTDGSFSYMGKKPVLNDWKKYTPSDIWSLLYDKGVTDTFEKTLALSTTLRKYAEKEHNTDEAILAVRLFDSDPTVRTGEFLAQRKLEEIIKGTLILAKSVSITRIALIAASDTDTVKKKAEECLESEKGFTISIFKADTGVYPCGGRREIKMLLKKNRFACEDMLAIDGYSSFMVYEAIALNKPVLEKYVQFSGTPLVSERMFRVRIGTPIRKLVDECGGFKQSVYKIVTNGLLKGTAVSDLDTPVTADLQSVTFLPKTIVPFQKQVNCIRCGRCHRVCPKGIHADKLFSYYYFHTETDSRVLQMADECTLCGVCDTACPARLPLAQTISLLQGGLK